MKNTCYYYQKFWGLPYLRSRGLQSTLFTVQHWQGHKARCQWGEEPFSEHIGIWSEGVFGKRSAAWWKGRSGLLLFSWLPLLHRCWTDPQAERGWTTALWASTSQPWGINIPMGLRGKKPDTERTDRCWDQSDHCASLFNSLGSPDFAFFPLAVGLTTCSLWCTYRKRTK